MARGSKPSRGLDSMLGEPAELIKRGGEVAAFLEEEREDGEYVRGVVDEGRGEAWHVQ